VTGIGNAGVQSASSRGWGRILCGGHHQLALENFVLHQQLTVYKRSVTRPKLRTTGRLFSVGPASVTHLSLDNDAPDNRPIERPELGAIIPIPEVDGLHSSYMGSSYLKVAAHNPVPTSRAARRIAS